MQHEEELGAFGHFVVNEEAFYREIDRSTPGCDSARAFVRLFEAELNRITDYNANQEKVLELSAMTLLSNVASFSDHSSGTTSTPIRISPDILEGLRNQAHHIVQTSLAFRCFINKNAELLQNVAANADRALFTDCLGLLHAKLDRVASSQWFLTPIFSDLYASFQLAEKQNKFHWVAPSTFERVTTKYWVEESNLHELLWLSSTQVPLLVYGKTGRLTDDRKFTRGQADWSTLATNISSVYFDSPKMHMYHSRIVREEGAKLFRVRWYGNKPTGSQPIFLELKTHHEQWVNSKSVKERVSIRVKDMTAFLSVSSWTPEEAQTYVKAANPKLQGIELQKATELLLTMHELVVKLDLRPCVRTVYSRVAFQSSENNSLRLTVDRDINVIDESGTTPESWGLPEEAASASVRSKKLPYSVFEVKLAGTNEAPQVIQNMEEDGLIINAAKFSKFLTGAACFRKSKLRKLPYWASDSLFQSLFGLPPRAEEPRGKVSFTEVPLVDESDTQSTLSGTSSSSDPEDQRLENSAKNQTKRSRKKRPSLRFLRRRPNESNEAKILPRTRVRVEPKTYFANERTFVQWVSGSMLLLTISVLILDFGHSIPLGMGLMFQGTVLACFAVFNYYRRLKLLTSGSAYGYVDHFGPAVLSLSVIAGIVVLTWYFYEEAQTARSSSILANVTNATIHPTPGVCISHKLEGVSRLEYQPSDILVDGPLMLVPSSSQITGLTNNGPVKVLADIPGMDFEAITKVGKDRIFAISEGKKESMLMEFKYANEERSKLELVQNYSLPSENVEGVTYVPDENSGKLYVAANKELDSGIVHGKIDVYRIPMDLMGLKLSMPEGLEVDHSLNSNMLQQDLLDSKIASLHYFEDILYVLHDNAQKIRGWDLKKGEIVLEWDLPRVGGNFDKQWEGLQLQRKYHPTEGLWIHLTLDSPPAVWSVLLPSGNETWPECARPSTNIPSTLDSASPTRI